VLTVLGVMAASAQPWGQLQLSGLELLHRPCSCGLVKCAEHGCLAVLLFVLRVGLALLCHPADHQLQLTWACAVPQWYCLCYLYCCCELC
jgi:hypothetical protein